MSRAICAEEENVTVDDQEQHEFEEIDKLTELAVGASDVKKHV
jgi:hypothetical protein